MSFSRETAAASAGAPPWRRALLAQGVSLLLVLAAWRLTGITPLLALLLQAALAVLLSVLLRQPRWWWLLHAVFVPAVVAAQALPWPPWVWLLALLSSWALFGAVQRSRVPLYLSSRRAIAALDALLPGHGRMLDVGAGTGTVLAHLVRRHGLQLEGVEHAWLPWLLAMLRLRRRSIRVWRGDWAQLDFADYDIVYAFLSPATMPELWHKAMTDMRPGSLLVSNRFAIPGVPADEEHRYGERPDQRLLLWRIPASGRERPVSGTLPGHGRETSQRPLRRH